jgi:hypothetical protein
MIPLVIESEKPLQLPPICACCGALAKYGIDIKPTDPSAVGQDLVVEGIGAFVHPIGLLISIKKLASPSVRIPMCKGCRLKHFLPGRNTLFFMALHVLFFADAFYHGFKTQYGYMFLDLLLAMACLVVVVRKNTRHNFITLPVRVSLHGGKFRYAIYDGPLYSYFEKQKLPPAGLLKIPG